ncbi:MAG: YgiQ family radical SAM protein [Alphaproteobacteria bacterium]|nr:YgiQ family radical SAM protein [Alphaproteobacteria bacterium]MBT4967138.1 YgiQ family radical SAM protein [Alphaproteobacteria bacterium]MBT5161985.1 YgiQ family radical SAM protein [Alphaproteobacteria bacterium]MBT5918035.1 YgiQ family radical SAM protein [Alphaproteobacteria bacterium]MBT6385534.1 YgiQ family radical SAM protein [Alphaproteobacteria bacterium]
MNTARTHTPKKLFSWRKHWAHRLGPSPFLPMSRAEMDQLGWDSCDVILVTGDAYVDHPSFGMAVIGRVLEAQGFRVGIIAQPDWQTADPFKILGKPNLFFGVTGGNMDSMVNRYTADRRLRHNDSYTPDDEGGKRPDRAVIVYTQRCREAYKDVPVIVGGIEASLRRIAHYDYWSDKVRRSVLVDSKADMLMYGNAERAIVEVAHRLAKGEHPSDMRDVRGTAFMLRKVPEDWSELDLHELEGEGETPEAHKYTSPLKTDDKTVVRLPAFEQVRDDPVLYGHTSRILHQESNPGNARPLVQTHGDRELWLTPPPVPLTTPEMDGVFDLDYARSPHPDYGTARIPAWEMIRFSVNIMRGCFGGCSFCSITEHEGRIIQNRSEGSILREIEAIRDKVDGFTGMISDLGGPTANMYRMQCKDPKIEQVCRRLSCVYPDVCKNLKTDHDPLIKLYRKARDIKGVKKIAIASGLRYDLAVRSPAYIRELAKHHVGGYLKIAPEHTEDGPLTKMMKPGIDAYDRFKTMFDAASKEAGKEQYLIPYFIAAHPGTTDEDMMNLAIWLKKNGFRADQVQTFLPSPMSLASAMYYSERNPLRPVRRENTEIVRTAKGLKQRRLHKAFLRYHDAENWPLLRGALKNMGRADLIGNSKKHLIPTWQPKGTGVKGSDAGRGRQGQKNGPQSFVTTHSGDGRRPKSVGKGRKPARR